MHVLLQKQINQNKQNVIETVYQEELEVTNMWSNLNPLTPESEYNAAIWK